MPDNSATYRPRTIPLRREKKIHDRSQWPRLSCVGCLEVPAGPSRLYVCPGTEVWPCTQISASNFPSSQPAQEMILNSSWFSKPGYLRRERWVSLLQLETSDVSCSPNPAGSIRLPPRCNSWAGPRDAPQPCAHRFVIVGLPKDTVLFPTSMGSLDHLQHPTRPWDMARCHLPSAGTRQASVQP